MSLKRIFCAMLALATLFCLAGCKLVQVNSERDLAQVVAIVEDQKIYKREYKQMLQSVLSQYGLTEADLTGADYASIAESLRSQVLDMLIEQKVQLIKAKDLGLDRLTEEDEADIQANADALVKTLLENARQNISAEDATLSEEMVEQRAQEQVEEFRAENGYTDEYLNEYYTNLKIVEKVREYTVQDVTLTDDEVYTNWNTKCDEAKASYSSSPTAFATDLFSDATIYYYNETTHRVKHILLKLSDEDINEITALRQDGDDEGADALRAEKVAGLDEKLAEVQKKLGEKPDQATFDEVMQEYSEDTGLASYPDGYVMCASTTAYMPEFTEGGMALQNIGDSSVVITDSGYHILFLDYVWSVGVVPYDTVKDDLRTNLKEEKENRTYYTVVDTWWDAMDVTTYAKRLV